MLARSCMLVEWNRLWLFQQNPKGGQWRRALALWAAIPEHQVEMDVLLGRLKVALNLGVLKMAVGQIDGTKMPPLVKEQTKTCLTLALEV